MTDGPTPREALEEFVLNQIDARKAIVANFDMEETNLKMRLAAVAAERDSVAAQIEDWIRWMGLLK